MRSSRHFSFLNSPKKLVFVCIEGSTFIGVSGTTIPYCLFVTFCAFTRLSPCAFAVFGAFGACKIFL